MKFGKWIVLFILLPTIIWSQGFDNPHDVVYNHLHNLEPDNRNVTLSAQSFHPDFTLERREEMAENLKRVLDAKGMYIHVANIPRNSNYKDSISGNQVYSLVSKLPSITVEKYENRWYYSKSLEKDIPRLFRSTFPTWSLSLVNGIPESLKTRILGIAIWKILGLFIILLCSYILFKIFEKVVDKLLEVSIWKKLKMDAQHLHLLHKLARYFGIAFFMILIKYFLPLLMLEIRVSSPLFKIINILITYFLMMAVLKMVDIGKEYVRQLASATQSKTDDQLIPILTKSLKVLVVVVGIIRILYLMDVNVTALIAGLSIGGLALALAAQDTVKNLIGSAMIFFDKPFQVGDYIVAMDFEGTVEEVGFRSSRIRKVDTSLITVPNGNLTNATMVNYGIRRYRLFETNLGFMYDSNPEDLKSFADDLKQFLSTYDKIQPDNFYVTLRHLSASSIDIFFRVYIDAQTFKEELIIREQLIYIIMEKAKQHHLSFAFPSTSVYVEQLPEKN